MILLRKHWFDIGGILAMFVLIFLFLQHNSLTNYQLLMWSSLLSLFFHQLEEYRITGTFPGMINKVMYKSAAPDRYPLNPDTAFYINVFLGWGIYFLAAVFAEKAIWLGTATMMVSLGNVMAHTFVFNIKGKTLYNAGLATCWLFFVPCIFFFFRIVFTDNLPVLTELFAGIILGIILNFVGVLKLIEWMANKNTAFIFEQRNLLPGDRKNNI